MQHPEEGHVMDEATIRKDFELLKQFNFNAVRTSHYPPVNKYLELANEYGLYIIDEVGDEAQPRNGFQVSRNTKRCIASDAAEWCYGTETIPASCSGAQETKAVKVSTLPTPLKKGNRWTPPASGCMAEMHSPIRQKILSDPVTLLLWNWKCR